MTKKLFFAAAIPLAMFGCGSDDDGGGGGGGASYEDVVAALENPTGSIESAEGAQGVADAFEDLQAQEGFSGDRRSGINCETNTTNGQVTCECSGGGSLEVTGGKDDGPSGDVSGHWDANNCCETGGCCYDGTLDILVGTDAGATYTLCYFADYDVSECKTASVNIQYCQDDMGRQWWVVEYQSETYAVSGSYNSKTGGSWTVRDANGEWTCTSDGATGSCTNGTDTYDW